MIREIYSLKYDFKAGDIIRITLPNDICFDTILVGLDNDWLEGDLTPWLVEIPPPFVSLVRTRVPHGFREEVVQMSGDECMDIMRQGRFNNPTGLYPIDKNRSYIFVGERFIYNEMTELIKEIKDEIYGG